jgi:hypothetical protein
MQLRVQSVPHGLQSRQRWQSGRSCSLSAGVMQVLHFQTLSLGAIGRQMTTWWKTPLTV